MSRSILLSSFIILCAVIAEASVLANISFLYVVPDIVLICTIYFSLLNGSTVGVSTGFISGLFLDFITGVPFGFNCVLRTIIGYVYGFFSETVILAGVVVPVVTVGIGTIFKAVLISLIQIFFPNINIYVAGIFSYQFLFEFFINIILAPVFFKVLRYFKEILSVASAMDKVDNV